MKMRAVGLCEVSAVRLRDERCQDVRDERCQAARDESCQVCEMKALRMCEMRAVRCGVPGLKSRVRVCFEPDGSFGRKLLRADKSHQARPFLAMDFNPSA